MMRRAITEPVACIWRRRSLVRELSRRELTSRFLGSMLGSIWFLLQPITLLGVYYLVFGVLRARNDAPEFVPRLFVGILVYGLFSETISRSPQLVVSRPNFVKKVRFPLDVLPIPSLVTSLVGFGFALIVLLSYRLIWLDGIHLTSLLVPVLVLPLLMMTLGLSWLISALGVFIRDVQEIVRVIVQLLFFLSPVIWTLEDVATEELRSLAMLNPLTVFIEWIRGAVARGETPDPTQWLGFTLGAFVVMGLGHAFFRRTRVGFADVL